MPQPAIQPHQKDFTAAKVAPVVLCVVVHGGKFLVLKRSDRVLAYKNLWSSLAGFLDTDRTAEEHVVEELQEEIRCQRDAIERIKKVDEYPFVDRRLHRTWIRHLYRVDVRSPQIELDWEHTDYKWVSLTELNHLETTPGLREDFAKVAAIGR